MDRQYISAKDLKNGEEKVVTYVGKDYTITVPDPSWNMTGDLSKLPDPIRDTLEHYSKNGFTKEQVIISPNAQTMRHPSGRYIIQDISTKGFSVDTSKIVFSGEFNERGQKIS